ncbi:MAG TPA: hypothetical protein VFR06_00365 [Gallionellaceae bacterium]|nr:hypothetical protein [Gallionellaceae bacterium]
MPHLLVDISAHGYGHIAQTAPVVRALLQQRPDLRVTVRCGAAHSYLQQRFQCPFQHIPQSFDFGMQMASAVEVKVAESAAAYRAFHTDWPRKVARAAEEMAALKPDLLLANVPYLSLAAAHAARIRSVALCSLNWADIYQHYCVQDAASRTIHAQMLEAYNSAEHFLQPQPAMAMPQLANAQSIAPIVQPASSQREHLIAQGLLPADEKWVLVAMGGMEYRLPIEHWPRLPGVRWLVAQSWNIRREDVSAYDALGIPFSDLLASCDAVLTKPGYGTFAEAACTGVPLLYVSRRDWPEEPFLVQWLQQHGVCREVSRVQAQAGELREALQAVWNAPRPTPPQANGAEEAAQFMLQKYF